MNKRKTREGWEEQFQRANENKRNHDSWTKNTEFKKAARMSWNYRIMRRKY